MKPLVINTAFGERRVGHNNINKKVKDHSPAELKLLAIEARKSDNRILLECFTGELPTLEELTTDKVDTQLAAITVAPALDAVLDATPAADAKKK